MDRWTTREVGNTQEVLETEQCLQSHHKATWHMTSLSGDVLHTGCTGVLWGVSHFCWYLPVWGSLQGTFTSWDFSQNTEMRLFRWNALDYHLTGNLLIILIGQRSKVIFWAESFSHSTKLHVSSSPIGWTRRGCNIVAPLCSHLTPLERTQVEYNRIHIVCIYIHTSLPHIYIYSNIYTSTYLAMVRRKIKADPAR